MAVKQLSERSQQVVKKLDEIIALSEFSFQQLSFSSEVILKLISAMAIAVLVEYLLISDKSNWIIPLNPYLLITYLICLILFGNYVIGKSGIVLRVVQSIAVAIYGIYTLAILDNPWNLAQSQRLPRATSTGPALTVGQYLNILYLIKINFKKYSMLQSAK